MNQLPFKSKEYLCINVILVHIQLGMKSILFCSLKTKQKNKQTKKQNKKTFRYFFHKTLIPTWFCLQKSWLPRSCKVKSHVHGDRKGCYFLYYSQIWLVGILPGSTFGGWLVFSKTNTYTCISM